MSIEIKQLNITGTVSEKQVTIVKDVNCKIAKGEILAIIGQSGSGKTMTAMSLLGLLPENCSATGEIAIESTTFSLSDTKKLNKLLGSDVVFIPQSGSEFLDPSFKIKTQIFESLDLLGIKKKADKLARATELLLQVGFSQPKIVLELYPFQLSGGMAQRVLLAIGIATPSKLVIADEPTRGIDSKSADNFFKKLPVLCANSAVILITHNLEMAKKCSHVMVMKDGEVVEFGSALKVLETPTHQYTKSLIENAPENFDYTKLVTRR